MILQTTGGFSDDALPDDVLPLGTWCTSGNVRPVRTAQDLPNDDDLDVEIESARIVQALEASLYPALNLLHGVTFPESYWEQSVGMYFRMLVPLLVRRYNLIRRARDHGCCDKFLSVGTCEEIHVPPDRRSIVLIANSHMWNHAVMNALCKTLGLEPFLLSSRIQLTQDLPAPPRQVDHRWPRKLLDTGLNSIATRSRFLISRTMLPRRTEFMLAARNLTLPFQWYENFPQDAKINFDLRNYLSSNLPDSSDDNDSILRIAAMQIPKVFVEDYARARHFATKKLPNRPEVLFTSNLHHASDVFLMWLAEARMNGTKVVIAQHGGVHSLCRDVPADIESERVQSDRYITWGRPGFDSTIAVAGPTLVNIGVKRTRKRKFSSGPLLVVLDSSYRYPSVPRGMNGDRFAYAELLNLFLAGLDPEVIDEVVIRPYPGGESFDDPITPLIHHNNLRVTIDDCRGSIQGLMSESRIIVSTALGTTLFKALHQRIPTTLLLDPELSPLSKNVQDQFELLQNASVFFTNPHELAAHINKNFKSVEAWWLSDSVQHGVARFEEELSPRVTHPISFYSRQLQEVVCRVTR